jgi:hypothetical protein
VPKSDFNAFELPEDSASLRSLVLELLSKNDEQNHRIDAQRKQTEQLQVELVRVKRRKGRRNLANFENLPVTTHVYELSEAERACPAAV